MNIIRHHFSVAKGQDISNQFMARGLDFFMEDYIDEVVGHSLMRDDIAGRSQMSNIDGHSLLKSEVTGRSKVKEKITGHSIMTEEIKNYGS